MAHLDNRLTLQKLEVFVTVAKLGGVTKAAERLFVTQPVVTQHLRDIEDRVGAVLFSRSGRTMTLTPAGRVMYRWATETLARGDEAARELQEIADGARGDVSVAASMTFGSYVLPKTLVQFAAERPRANVELLVADADSALRSVAEGRCDFGVAAADSVADSSEFDIIATAAERLVLVAGASSPVGSSVQADDLGSLPFVCSSREMSRRKTIDAALALRGIHRSRVVLAVNHPEAVKRAVADGAGVALLMRRAVTTELADGRLRAVAVGGLDVTVPVHVVTRRGKSLTPVQRTLLERVVATTTSAPSAA